MRVRMSPTIIPVVSVLLTLQPVAHEEERGPIIRVRVGGISRGIEMRRHLFDSTVAGEWEGLGFGMV